MEDSLLRYRVVGPPMSGGSLALFRRLLSASAKRLDSCAADLSAAGWLLKHRLWNRDSVDVGPLQPYHPCEGDSGGLELVELDSVLDVDGCEEDRWCSMALLFRLTEVWEGSIAIAEDHPRGSASPGATECNLLLEEAVDELPEWCDDVKTMEGRVVIVDGRMVLIPPIAPSVEWAHAYDSSGSQVGASLQDGQHPLPFQSVVQLWQSKRLSSLWKSLLDDEETVSCSFAVRKRMQSAVVESYSSAVHRAVLQCPKYVAWALCRSPRLVNVAISELSRTSPQDRPKLFGKLRRYNPGSETIRVTLPVTRFAFARAAIVSLPSNITCKPAVGKDAGTTAQWQEAEGRISQLSLKLLLGLELCWRRDVLGCRAFLDEAFGLSGEEMDRSLSSYRVAPLEQGGDLHWWKELEQAAAVEDQTDAHAVEHWAKTLIDGESLSDDSDDDGNEGDHPLISTGSESDGSGSESSASEANEDSASEDDDEGQEESSCCGSDDEQQIEEIFDELHRLGLSTADAQHAAEGTTPEALEMMRHLIREFDTSNA